MIAGETANRLSRKSKMEGRERGVAHLPSPFSRGLRRARESRRELTVYFNYLNPRGAPFPLHSLRDWFNSVRRVVRELHGIPST